MVMRWREEELAFNGSICEGVVGEETLLGDEGFCTWYIHVVLRRAKLELRDASRSRLAFQLA
jgi:hypothetical protein